MILLQILVKSMEWNVCFLELLLFALTLNFIAGGSNAEKNELTARFSENNLQGSVRFKKGVTEDIVTVTAFVKNLQPSTGDSVSWSIRQLPVDYTSLENRCSNRALGSIRHDLDSMLGRLGLNKNVEFSVSTSILSLTGSQGIWLSSVVLELPDGSTACATLTVSNTTDVRIGKVKFFGPIFGTVHFFWIGITGSETDTVIVSDLYHVHKHKLASSQHKWGIYVTDILESIHDKAKYDCNTLQLPYDGLSDLSPKIGKLVAGGRNIYRDPTLTPIDLYQTDHIHFLAVYDDVHKDSFLSCAPILLLPETVLKSLIESQSIKANVILNQRSPFDPTFISYSVTGYHPNLGSLRIHALPFLPNYFVYNETKCFGIKEVFNPTNKGIGEDSPFPYNSTQDKYAVGDLTGKLGFSIRTAWDVFLPLTGPSSVFHRSVAIYKAVDTVEVPWLCGILIPFASVSSNTKLPITTAEVIFQYPISGRIIFKQIANREYADTNVIVESLVYSDGSTETNSFHHNWTINADSPGKDYYDWQNRCTSAGPVFHPFKIADLPNSESVNYFNYAQLVTVLGTLSVVARKSLAIELTRKFFVHPNLPLAGHNSIIGKSLVIYDENGPKARGNRLACSRIYAVNRRKAVIRDWFGNGEPVSLMGDIEMYQMSEYDNVDVEIKLQGLHGAKEYHIHMVPIQEELQFPCENSTLYEVWNPLPVYDKAISEANTTDQFKMGDLSGKYGTWDNTTTVNAVYNDSNLQIFGFNSLVGRSFVINQEKKNRRWACATIERGYSPSEARELRAIASFHHPLGYTYGYIKMTQLVHVDGSKSDTIIEVNLRYPGKQNRNVTRNHFWLIYVNPVSVDATVEPKTTRCTAAGYVWNPNFIQLAAPLNDDLYYRECGPDQPYRCYVGDLSGRLGTISVGAERQVFSDPNLPLEGNISAMGRSIVILDKNKGHDKFSCANIEPDKDIIKYANVRKSPKFVLDQFLSDLRDILGTPEWMLTVDNRKTKVLHNGACVQLLFHFKGPNANEIEQDFSKLMRTGKLASPTIFNPGYVPPSNRKRTINYQLCPSRDTDFKKRITDNGGPPNGGRGASIIIVSHFIIYTGFIKFMMRCSF